MWARGTGNSDCLKFLRKSSGGSREEEVEKIIEAAEGRYKVLFHLAYTTGMRAGELFGLRVEDFNFDAGTVRVMRSTFRNIEDTPKTQKGRRTIYLDRRTQEDVRVLLAGRTSG